MTALNQVNTTLFEEEYNLADGTRNETPKQTRFPKRYVIMLLLFFGQINVFIMRVNLNLALVEMTSNKTIIMNNQTIIEKAEFDWNSKTKGVVLSLFFYGYLTMLSLGGYFATKFGGVSTYGFGVFVTAIFTVLTPVNLYLSFYWFAFCRVMEGAAEALSYTSTADICSRWTRPEERSKMVAFVFTGVHVGTAVAFPMCGKLAKMYGWPSIFYVTGGLSLAWFCIWIMIATNDPSPHDTDLKPSRRWRSRQMKEPYPWKNLLTSRSVWVLFVAKIAYGWGYNLMVQCFPQYVKDATGASIDKIGYLSAAPNFAGLFTVFLSGCLIDYMINKDILTPTYTHKVIMCASLFISASFLAAVPCVTNFGGIFVLFIFFKMTLSFIYIIEQLMPIYLSPRYSSGISGITAYGYTLANIISPTIFGFVVTDHSMTQWNTFFNIATVLSVITSVIFGLFSSSELESWSAADKFQQVDQ